MSVEGEGLPSKSSVNPYEVGENHINQPLLILFQASQKERFSGVPRIEELKIIQYHPIP